MRASWWIGIGAAFLSSPVASIETAPFSPAHNAAGKRAFEVLQLLKRADNNCPSGYNACTKLGHSDVCCTQGTNCSRDSANNIACCPTGASCTGSLTGTSTGSTSETGSSFQFPQGATATTTDSESTTATITGSTVSGAYPFIYVPTTFSNAATCSSYYSLCQSEYTQCTAALMGRYGVTVNGGAAGGVTVEAVTATSQATSICSSLSAEACHGLRLSYCATVDSESSNSASGNGALSGRTSSLHDLVFGLAVGVAGLFV
ncbi:hypothetical protein N7462_007642 [Penicillium macrosclerotiorum]|uniref:uncharacterized protein n=1 Tax=Penicillium macrosclerotiorum TaxID=303699 RepID=UPI0025466E74|nr:uncharacterized protein N7462_007642 [Penicillium macrosclerotiorum]KAJ5679398.1 hypothetical protein N7462_007642 [Penicillium macrosclerotiorum]